MDNKTNGPIITWDSPFTMSLTFSTKQDVADFISDIKETMKKSEKSGGEYGLFRQDGKKRLCINFHLPPKLKGM
jgi:hypothetical protein